MENELMEQDVIKIVENAIMKGHETIIPTLRDYLNQIREIRMSMVRECKEIIQSSRDLSEITKQTKTIIEFAKAIDTLDRTLTPDLVIKLNKIVKE